MSFVGFFFLGGGGGEGGLCVCGNVHQNPAANNSLWQGNVGGTSQRQGGAHMGFSERIDTVLN